ncbi:MLF1 isoform 14 [Pan troglodytes]|uniref:MLF1 isoform 14 n=1 Tax=Pan troglodytes TaxID=9598 RepID=A0A2J8P233_PANTR|nr:MLF1 isoform 14 [Pan troglodytes]
MFRMLNSSFEDDPFFSWSYSAAAETEAQEALGNIIRTLSPFLHTEKICDR